MKREKAVAKPKLSGIAVRGDQNLYTLRREFYQSVAEILRAARANAYRTVNLAMVEAYWIVGRMIVEEEQRGQERAQYGAALIKNLSIRLSREFGKGFTETNLKYFRQFYLAFPDQTASRIGHTLCDQLTWSHYRLLMRVEKPDARTWYLKEAADNNWSVRALERQINSLYHERLLMSRRKAPVIEEMREKIAPSAPQDFIKDSVLNENRQLFASKYMLYLPTEEALREELERERALVVREQRARYEREEKWQH